MKEKKAATAAAPTAAKKKSEAATAPASKKRECGGAGGGRPRKRARDDGDGDLISKLPDDILGTIISLLPTKDGARTQALARRWHPLWRSAPLNLDCSGLCTNKFKLLSVVSKILSDHHGPARCFLFYCIRLDKDKKRFAQEVAQIEKWFHSRALDGLQKLDIRFPLDSKERYLLLPSGAVFRCASTLIVAKICFCDFPKEIAPSSLTPASLRNMISTVKVLALEFSIPDLDAVIDVLRCFPCLEKLYVTYKRFLNIPLKENVHQYDPTDPVKCLETHLKELVLQSYEANEQDVCFAKFFVLNAKVLKQIKFGVSEKINKEWVTDQYKLLEEGTKASPDAQLKFIRSGRKSLYAHELQIPSPDLV